MFFKPHTEGFYKYSERPGDPKHVVQISRNAKGSLKATTHEGEVFLIALIGGEWDPNPVQRPVDWPTHV
jgi:hypothetical protein